MRTFLAFAVVLFASFVVEGAIRHFPLIFVRLDLVWLVVLAIGFRIPLFPGGIWVLAIGMAQESLGAPLHGVMSLSYLAIFFFIRGTHRHLFFQGVSSQMIWIVILTLARRAVETGLLAWLGYDPSPEPLQEVLAAAIQGIASLALFPFLGDPGEIGRKRDYYYAS